MKRYCPNCGSLNVENYPDLAIIKCKDCGYDELKKN